jgi:transposase
MHDKPHTYPHEQTGGDTHSKFDEIIADHLSHSLGNVLTQHTCKRRIIPRIARCGVEPKNRLGRYRWVVERTLSWLNRFRRLKIRYEHRADMHLAFLQPGCALISLRFLGSPRPTRENGRPGPPRTASAILGT